MYLHEWLIFMVNVQFYHILGAPKVHGSSKAGNREPSSEAIARISLEFGW